MKVSLKKAHELSEKMTEVEKQIPNAIVQIGEFDNVTNKILDRRNAIIDAFGYRFDAIIFRAQIRKQIDHANSQFGINDKLNQIAMLTRLITEITTFLNSVPEVADPIDIVERRQGKLQAFEGDNYFQEQKINTYALSKSNEFTLDLIEKVENWKLEKDALKDEVAALNIMTLIEIAPDVVDFLRNVKLIK